MREIKFRAWHPSNTEMVIFDLKKACGDSEISMHLCSLMTNTHPEGKDLLMQYTGLQDKNGVDIYEGDRLSDRPNYTITVVWDNEGARFGIVERGSNVILHLNPDIISKSFEVIGNIYENPELLGGES